MNHYPAYPHTPLPPRPPPPINGIPLPPSGPPSAFHSQPYLPLPPQPSQSAYGPPGGSSQPYGASTRPNLPPAPHINPNLPQNPYDLGAGSGYQSQSLGPGGARGREQERHRDGSVHEGRPDIRQGGGGPGRGGRGRSPDDRNNRRLGERDREGGRDRDRDREGRTIEDRLAKERPCRTLFVRNVSYEADSEALLASFASHGPVKDHFDLVKNRGMMFITYFDLRSAEAARDAMHNTQLGRRPIDVHYSLPRADETSGQCDRDKNQGSVLATIRNQRQLPEAELGRLAERYGAIKVIKQARNPDQKVVEFYDSRGAALFVDEMDNKPFMSGRLELRFVWDEPEAGLPPPQPSEIGRPPRRSGEGPGYGEVRGGGYRPPAERDGGRGPPGAKYDDRRRSGSHPSGPPPGRYGEAPQAAIPLPDDRLEQARKVQELLASLGSAAAPPAPQQPPQSQGYNPPPVVYQPPAHPYNPPPSPYNLPAASQSSYPPPPSQSSRYVPVPPTRNSAPAHQLPPSPYNPANQVVQGGFPAYTNQASPPRPQQAPTPPGPPGNIPADVYAMLQRPHAAPSYGPPPSNTGYAPPFPGSSQAYGQGAYQPPSSGYGQAPPPLQQAPQASYGQPPPPNQSHQQQYQPPSQSQYQPPLQPMQPPQGGQAKDVNSLLAMLVS